MDPVVDLTMQKNYISRRKKELDEIVDLPLDEENIQKIELIAHKMKGNGLSFGFPLISNLGGELEIRAKEKDLKKIQALLGQIKCFVDETFKKFYSSSIP